MESGRNDLGGIGKCIVICMKKNFGNMMFVIFGIRFCLPLNLLLII